jgi:hypothetical protein
MQNDTGGFGGGGKQTSHLATTYALVLALALVGGEDAFEVIDRRAMWKWLCALKQPDGGFQVSVGGEEDVRYVRGATRSPWDPGTRPANIGGVSKGGILRIGDHHLAEHSPGPDARLAGVDSGWQCEPPFRLGRVRPEM